jgi:hypothetical protein
LFQSDIGITVPGSKSEQKIDPISHFFTDGITHIIILKLIGETAEKHTIQNPITVKTKIRCPSCGKVNKATSKFCGECGTGLIIYA